MEQNNENKLTLEDFIKLANKVKKWKRNDVKYYDAPGFSWENALQITSYNYSGYTGKIRMKEDTLKINVYRKDYDGVKGGSSGSYYGIFFSDKNDPFFIKGDTSDAHILKNTTFIPKEHHIYLNTKNSDLSTNSNCLLIQEIYAKAEYFVKKIEQCEEDERKRKKLEEENIHEQEKNNRNKRIFEKLDILKSYIDALKNG
ncbi:MAG: hypothetical protein ACP5N1_04150 [Candidatus Woesearchaeota archaeon]